MASLMDRLKDAVNPTDNSDQIPDSIPPEMLEEFTLDPEPGKMRAAPRKAAKATATRTPARRTNLKKQVAEELEAYLGFVALPWSMRDPTCAMVLSQQSSAIADNLATLIARNPALAQKFLDAGVFGDWLGLFKAVWPVLSIVYAHHIAKSVGQENDSAPDFSIYQPFRT